MQKNARQDNPVGRGTVIAKVVQAQQFFGKYLPKFRPASMFRKCH